MEFKLHDRVVTLDPGTIVWERTFTVAPLVLVGTVEADGRQNFAPKHMAFPLGWEDYFGFVCAPHHRTYQNVVRTEVFTVSYPQPSQVLLTALAASPREEDDTKPSLAAMSTLPATQVPGGFFEDSYLFLECRLLRILDGFGRNSLIAGRIVAAHVHVDALRSAERDDHQLIGKSPLLVYLYPGRFARITQSYSFPFPAGFRK
jgi:flavin reductase (DIM6/NTAB) family NADH-FMN oxidoreductase RutF